MRGDSWHCAKELFALALDQPGADREAFLTRNCEDLSVRDEVRRLLRLHADSSDFLVSPIGPLPEPAEGVADPLIGRNLGGFVVVRQIGSGGIGAVYEALQEHPHRSAAVKVLRPGVLTPTTLRRFEYESEILARMRHPGIAQVFAAGTFELGGGPQPWFAMELINGPTLREHVERDSPSQSQRIKLLILLCDAVQHAHLCGIVHRDLKPDNILVESASADTRQPKVLDFGVARSINPSTHATMHTIAGELVGTLAYMSPEQLSADPQRIDARCDVFALGVIGFELLCGRLPHGDARSSIGEVVRAIEQDDPPRIGAIVPALRGDLEVVLAKALEKDPVRRYQSAAELAADLRRFLKNEPVNARPATAAYRVRKFVRRNPALVGGIATTIAALAVGLILYAREARTARLEAAKSRYEADKATAINNFITNDFLTKILNPDVLFPAGERPPVGELVRAASARIGTMFANQPLAQAAIHNEIGTIHYNLGTIDDASEQFQIALTLWESNLGPTHPDTLKAVNNLGQVRARQKIPAEAEALYLRALEGRRRVLGETDAFTLVTMNNLAELWRAGGRFDEAESLLRRTLEAQRHVQGSSHKNTITTIGNLGGLLLQRRRNDEAALLLREGYDACLATLGSDYALTAMTGARLGIALQRLGRPQDAVSVLTAVIAEGQGQLGESHPEILNARRTLAKCFRDLKDDAQAAAQLQKALAAAAARPGDSTELIRRIQKELEELTSPPSAVPPAERRKTDP